jgi:hypothetical protein
LFTQDGELLRGFELHKCSAALCIFTSGAGFDYIAYANGISMPWESQGTGIRIENVGSRRGRHK